jgi:hypothetical protein
MKKNLSKVRIFGALISLAMAALLLAGVFFLVSKTELAVQPAQAAPSNSSGPAEKVIVVNVTGTINIIDTATDIVYGPYLSGTIGSQGGATLDIAVTPDGNTALISNFGDSAVYFVDISDPFNPSVIVSATLPMFAEDIAISADSRFALVTDGGFNSNIATLDMISHTIVFTTQLGTHYSNAVAIAPNGTVVVADYFLGEISALKLEDTGELTYMGTYSYTIGADGVVTPSMGLVTQPSGVSINPDQAAPEIPLGVSSVTTDTLMRPVNIAIAPDGQTVLVCNVAPYWSNDTSALFHMGVYRITDSGVLSFSNVVTGLSRAVQSVAFSPDGRQAYLSGNGIVNTNYPYDNFNRLMVLDILGPGDVHLATNDAVDYPRQTTSQLFGVDTIALANGKLYLGYPTMSGADNILRIINVEDYSVFKLEMAGIPVGIGVIPLKHIYIPVVYKGFPSTQ